MAMRAKETSALVVVAHPDDEILWAGGTIVMHPDWRWTILCLCRRDDADRAPRFSHVLERLRATGAMGDLDDGPDQTPLADEEVAGAVLALLPASSWDVVFTHSPFGEYTRHRRHEETARAMIALWARGGIVTRDVRMFAYEDGDRRYHPRAIANAHVTTPLDDEVWRAKYDIVTGIYGFAADSWEAKTTPRVEAFWRFSTCEDCAAWKRREEEARRGRRE
jgi:LmbE family N-acetylglucosaminyl deacetylase